MSGKTLRPTIALGLVLCSGWARAQDVEAFLPLFNGRDLSGWTPVNTAPSTWTVTEGMLICSGKPTGELRTQRMYQNFILELEWRHLRPKGNAGVFVWADDITAPGVPFHRGIEVQVLENAYGNTSSHTTHGDIFPIHGAVMRPINGRGGTRAFPTQSRSRPSPQWNHYRIECRDGNITLAVNGEVVTRGTDCSPRKGYICLESEGGVVHYRNVRIRELPDTPIADEDIAVADRGFRSLYNGVDLSGWTIRQGGSEKWRVDDWVLQYQGAAADQGVLTTDEQFDDVEFIVDVRPRPEAAGLQFFLRGVEPMIQCDLQSEEWRKILPAGSWHRVHGQSKGDTLTLEVDGVELWRDRPVSRPSRRGPLALAPSGPIDFANLFVAAPR